MKRFGQIVCLIISLSIVLYSCSNTKVANSEISIMSIPKGFPAIVFPKGNEFTIARWSLGKRLFFDPILSLNNKISCASCHHPKDGFSDTIAFSLGDKNTNGPSNAPTLSNVAFNPYYTRAGGVPTLEMQILVPIQEHNEMNTNILDIVAKLKQDKSYIKEAKEAYNRAIDPFVITRALANFERSFISGNSAYDQYKNGGNPLAINDAAKRGLKLFISTKTNCTKCHSGFNFTNYTFENNGLYTHYKDSGRMRLTHIEADRARFKVPTLRNVGLTAPYMHDGSLRTLKEVVAHYNSGGKAHKNKSPFIKPLGLSIEEQNDLVAYLNSLSDNSFVHNKNFQQ